MIHSDRAMDVLKSWYANLSPQKHGMPARGVISAALVVIEQLKASYDLDGAVHRTTGGGQIRGASGAAVARILALFGETRRLVKEGGRTNRGSIGAAEALLLALAPLRLDSLPSQSRNEILTRMQEFLVERVRDFHNRERLKFTYNPACTAWQMINDVLAQARQTGKHGPVAQYLVGAKLQLKFPDIEVENNSYSTADDQLARPGDFCVGDTAFHVTVAPMPGVYDRCLRNIADGRRAFLLVPDSAVVGVRQNAEITRPGQIAVESIEGFVGTNVEEYSRFSADRLADGMKKLIETYNARVDAVELDKSMLIEMPPNLLKAGRH